MWYRRVYIGTLRTLFCISPRVLGRASIEIQSRVRFFHDREAYKLQKRIDENDEEIG